MTRFHAVIPARFGSTRLPGKPLLDIAGKPMVIRVYECALRSGAQSVVIATDDARIGEAADRAGAPWVLTSPDHPSGTDRLQEVATRMGWADDEIVVNVQGDEPLIDPALIGAVAQLLQTHPHASMGTAAHPLASVDELSNPNIVKVVCDAAGMAHYFSRAPIPFARDHAGQPWWHHGSTQYPALAGFAPLRHVGIYAYRVAFLRAFPQLAPAPLETTEALEQLRALWHGHRIAVYVTPTAPGPGVDTPEDLIRVRAFCTDEATTTS